MLANFLRKFAFIQKGLFPRCGLSHEICNSYTMGFPPVRRDNSRALASGLPYVLLQT